VRELFVWYRVRDERIADARAAVQAMQDALAVRWPGLHARLLTRDDAGGGGQTWMETYSRDAGAAGGSDGIDAGIEQAIATAARSLAALLDGTRHVEAFAISRLP
jgi:hypothetical protein